MNTLTIILAQSTTGPVLTIVGLLLVAALIGYLTAWFYAKSVYTPIIKGLEDDKVKLNHEISDLKDDISKLNKKIEDLNKKVDNLNKDVSEKEKEILKKVDIITGLEKEINEFKKKLKT